ncbi:MAG: AMP-binding protein [Pseudomonadota bacterium]|nr:AMP-binding protein [Pseudomonadota bacterium]
MNPSQGDISPFRGMDVPWLLALRARTSGEKPFLIWAPFDRPSRTWTYGEFHRHTGALAAGLRKRGVKQGDCVLIHMDNCVEDLLAWFACVTLGAIAVTTNTRSSPAEVAYFAAHSGAVGAITQPAYADMVASSAKDIRWMAVIDHDAGADPAAATRPARSEAFGGLFDFDAPAPVRPADPEAPCSVQFTSGTTSRPKAVLWTHANALWGAKINAVHEDLHADDRHLITMPLFHTNALAYSMLATLWVGASAVVQPRFSASRFWDVALEHRCTWASIIQFCVRALMDREKPDRHHFRFWGNGISEPPTDQHFGVKTIGWWGMTETITHGIIGEPYQPNIPLAIGRAAPEYRVRVVDDAGAPVQTGETGNLLLLGTPGLTLFKEYLGNEKATRDSFDDDGWFITGDRVTVLEDGFIRFGDRAKDMLKVGGENVSASEIEQIAIQVPGVREVAAVAKKHPMLDEVPVLFVIPIEGTQGCDPALAEKITAFCRERLADFKVPREVRLVDSMPRSTLEKVAKNELRKLLGD